MTWKESTIMKCREEFCQLATKEQEKRAFSEICRRFGVSRRVGYKWLNRYKKDGVNGLKNQAKEPRKKPNKTKEKTEKIVVEIRDKFPYWGGRKLKRYLENHGHQGVPAASTITQILRRNGKLDPKESEMRQHPIRFEYERPNELWQMDYKGYIKTDIGKCHPLTVTDDHSRYSIVLKAHMSQVKENVMKSLEEAFEKYGLPRRMLMDNGGPWGQIHREGRSYTQLTVWLMDFGVKVIHGRPFHPQTQGKEERFHRTLKREVLSREYYRDDKAMQKAFDQWQYIYNFERPHEALDLAVPADRYEISPRPKPRIIKAPEYDTDDEVRLVDTKGGIRFKGHRFVVGRAFYKRAVAMRPEPKEDGLFNVFYRHQKIKSIDLKLNTQNHPSKALEG